MTVEKNDICQEEGSFTFNWVAGDAIEKGDAVEMHSNGKAYKGAGTDPFVGVADHAVATGEDFAAYGPGGNKVWGKKGTNDLAVGDYAKPDVDGGFTTAVKADAVGTCIEVDGEDRKVLLY